MHPKPRAEGAHKIETCESRFKKPGACITVFYFEKKKFPGTFFPSVFCEVKKHLVGKTAGFATGYKNSPALPMRPN